MSIICSALRTYIYLRNDSVHCNFVPMILVQSDRVIRYLDGFKNWIIVELYILYFVIDKCIAFPRLPTF